MHKLGNDYFFMGNLLGNSMGYKSVLKQIMDYIELDMIVREDINIWVNHFGLTVGNTWIPVWASCNQQ